VNPATIVELVNGRSSTDDTWIGTLVALAKALEVEDFAAFLAPLTSTNKRQADNLIDDDSDDPDHRMPT
jgi:hypothetical protein